MTQFLLSLGTAIYDPDDMSLTGPDGLAIDLSRKAREVLACLADAAGDVVARETLVSTVWAEVAVEETAIARAVAELRHALGDSDRTVVVAQPRAGYQLQGTWVARPAPPAPPRSRSRLWLVLGVLAAGMVLAATLLGRSG